MGESIHFILNFPPPKKYIYMDEKYSSLKNELIIQ